MLLVGGLIVILTFVLIVKKYEARLVLFLAGLLMCLIGGLPGDVMKAFTKAMVNNSLVPTICTVMGFSYVMRLTTCDQHLVQSISGILKRGRAILVPISFFLTWWISLAIPSASGCSAAVGSILIPTLIAAGVHPAMAAATVLAGTWGSAISPGNAHNPFVADLAGTDMMTVIINETPASVIASIACVVVMTAYAVLRKEGATEERRLAYLKEIGEEGVKEESFHVRPLLAIVPLVPLFLLILGSKQVGLLPEISVPLSMLIGVALGFLVTLQDAQEICRKFFEGMGNAYADVIGLIVCASVLHDGHDGHRPHGCTDGAHGGLAGRCGRSRHVWPLLHRCHLGFRRCGGLCLQRCHHAVCGAVRPVHHGPRLARADCGRDGPLDVADCWRCHHLRWPRQGQPDRGVEAQCPAMPGLCHCVDASVIMNLR